MNNTVKFEDFKGLKAVTFNIHGRNTACYSLSFEGTEEMRMEKVAQAIIKTGADIACLNEFMPAKSEPLLSTLRAAGYEIYFPDRDMYDERFDNFIRMWCVTILAVKKELTFESSFDDSELSCRTVNGLLKFRNDYVAIIATHVPSVNDPNNASEMLRKRTALSEIATNIRKMQEKGYYILLLGDMNTDSGDACAGQFSHIEEKLVDKLPKRATWGEEKQLDRILISKDMAEACKETVFMLDRTPVTEGLTDHAMVGLGLQFEKEEG